MKVLVNNFTDEPKVEVNNLFPKKITCSECGSELEYHESDIEVGCYGMAYVKCPLCGYENDDEITSKYDIDITVDNIEFPKHFHHTSSETGAIDICNNNQIRTWINEIIGYFRENKDEFAYETASGNLTMHVYRYEGDEDYHIVVSNDYYETHIPFEAEDYRHSYMEVSNE